MKLLYDFPIVVILLSFSNIVLSIPEDGRKFYAESAGQTVSTKIPHFRLIRSVSQGNLDSGNSNIEEFSCDDFVERYET